MNIQMEKDSPEPGGLYVHIPFCMRKCPYCDFYSITDLSLRDEFVRALIGEMELSRTGNLDFDTIYIGGGTPPVLGVHRVRRLLAAANVHFAIRPNPEITLEANPGTIDPERLEAFGSSGINRIHIGVQSFREKNLHFLGRTHSPADARAALEESRKAGFANVGMDLIYGIPGQTAESWIDDLNQAVSFEPDHLSCYILTYAPGTQMENSLRKKFFRPMDDDQVAALFETTISFLADKNYAQYEISNFVRIPPGEKDSSPKKSRHNMKYWSLVPYIGLGPSAHSFVKTVRWWNHRSLTTYFHEVNAGRLPVDEKEVLSDSQQMIEAIYLGLRKTEGIDLEAFHDKFGVNFHKLFGKTVSDLLDRGFVKADQSRCALSVKGMLLLDSIAAMLVC